jgi:hypothetical protein
VSRFLFCTSLACAAIKAQCVFPPTGKGNSNSAIFCFGKEKMNSYRKQNAQSQRKNTILRQLCALRKSCARLFVQIKACANHKVQSFVLHSL